jgi:hypothetical protein
MVQVHEHLHQYSATVREQALALSVAAKVISKQEAQQGLGWEQEPVLNVSSSDEDQVDHLEGAPSEDAHSEAPSLHMQSSWMCHVCTYSNPAMFLSCEICATTRSHKRARRI